MPNFEKLYSVSMAVWPDYGPHTKGQATHKFSAWTNALLWRISTNKRHTSNFVDVFISFELDEELQFVHAYIPNGLLRTECVAQFIDPSLISYKIIRQLIGINPGQPQEMKSTFGEYHGSMFCKSFPMDGRGEADVYLPNLENIDKSYYTRKHHHVLTSEERRDPSDEIDYRKKYSGTDIAISVNSIRTAVKENHNGNSRKVVVFGFRTELPEGTENPFMHFHAPADRALLSGFDELNFIDFRVNDSSSLPQDVMSKVAQAYAGGHMKSASVGLRLSYCCNILYRLEHSSPGQSSSRLLERRLWTGYTAEVVAASWVNDRTYVYSWDGAPHLRNNDSAGNGIKSDFIKNVSARLSVRRSDENIMKSYIFFFTIISAAASGIGSAWYNAFANTGAPRGASAEGSTESILVTPLVDPGAPDSWVKASLTLLQSVLSFLNDVLAPLIHADYLNLFILFVIVPFLVAWLFIKFIYIKKYMRWAGRIRRYMERRWIWWKGLLDMDKGHPAPQSEPQHVQTDCSCLNALKDKKCPFGAEGSTAKSEAETSSTARNEVPGIS